MILKYPKKRGNYCCVLRLRLSTREGIPILLHSIIDKESNAATRSDHQVIATVGQHRLRGSTLNTGRVTSETSQDLSHETFLGRDEYVGV